MNINFETKKLAEGYKFVIGCDEVGRGCLAGPVVAAAVVLPSIKYKVLGIMGIKDSKLLSPKKRQELSVIIKEIALAWSIAEVSPKEIDEINIHNASLLAMRKAVEGLELGNVVQTRGLPYIFIDGKFKIPDLDAHQEPLIGGDNKVLSIAAASIIAKVYRDELMKKMDAYYPNYGLAKHKGYATKVHRNNVIIYGLTPIHRISFCKNLK
jgi:ribonuclease HII